MAQNIYTNIYILKKGRMKKMSYCPSPESSDAGCTNKTKHKSAYNNSLVVESVILFCITISPHWCDEIACENWLIVNDISLWVCIGQCTWNALWHQHSTILTALSS